MAEEVHVPGAGEVPKKWVAIVGGLAGTYVAFRWYRARSASAAAAAAGATPLPVDTSNTAGAQGDTGFNNPAPGSGPTSFNTDALTTNAQWSTKVEQDLVNIGYDGQTVATALGLYLSSQPLTPDQQAIIRVAWAMDGKAPESSNLPIIPAQTPPTGGGSTTPPPPPPSGGSSTPPPPPDPHAGQHLQPPQVATLVAGHTIRQWQATHPSNSLALLQQYNAPLGIGIDQKFPNNIMFRTSEERWVPN